MDDKTLRRFAGFVRRDQSGCWLWMGGKNWQGYGLFYLDGGMRAAHRVSYAVRNGPIPNGLCVLHTCDNPPCVNPDHLWLGTRRDNSHDSIRKGRRDHCPVNPGSRHFNARLTEEEVIEMRARYASGCTKAELLRNFDVTAHNLDKILYRRTWRHI